MSKRVTNSSSTSTTANQLNQQPSSSSSSSTNATNTTSLSTANAAAAVTAAAAAVGLAAAAAAIAPTTSTNSTESSSTTSSSSSISSRNSITKDAANAATPSVTSLPKAAVAQNSRAVTSSAASVRSATSNSQRNSAERSNEVPPPAKTMRQTSTTPSAGGRSANDFTAHFDNIDPPPSQSISPPMPPTAVAIFENSIEQQQPQQRIKKRPLTNAISTENDGELVCPICFDLIKAAHVTRCGHSFCQVCIQTALEHSHRCPKCNTTCVFSKDVFPNFALNQIVERYREEVNAKKCKFVQGSATVVRDILTATHEELSIEDVNALLEMLTQRRDQLKMTSKKVTEQLLYDFLKHLQQVKTDELTRIQHELNILNEDCKQVEELLEKYKATESAQQPKSSSTAVVVVDSGDENSQSQQAIFDSTESSAVKPDTSASSSSSSDSKSSENTKTPLLTNKKRIVHKYFDELSQTYINASNKDLNEFGSTSDLNKSVLDQIRQTVSKVTSCTELKQVASVCYNSDTHNASSIVSSVDFNSTYDRFAVAGVTKRIKIYDFNNLISKPMGYHYPLHEMVHNSKLSCICWNNYFKQQIVCSDYDGIVTLWDAENQSLVRSYNEHEKRCWSVDFCDIDPRLIASASDDTKVKIWSTNSEYSLLSIDAKSNVCCVTFKPQDKFHVLFGTADHSIYYYDLRMPKEPVSLFKGHKKAVSYVKFANDGEFVSASTDNNLKLWKLNEGQCVRSFTGHTNEKNFVGLDTHDGYIVTGSENNTVYLYCNDISKPLITYKFDDSNLGTGTKKEESGSEFVSAVCWSNQNYVLAANSLGVVKVLELT